MVAEDRVIIWRYDNRSSAMSRLGGKTAVMQMPTELLLELRDTFNTFFNEDSLNEFALALGVDYENLPGSGKSAKARELALHLWRHSLLTRLAAVGPKRRSDIDWAGLLHKHGIEIEPEPSPLPSHRPTSIKVSSDDLKQLVPILAGYPMFRTAENRDTLLTFNDLRHLVNANLEGPPRIVAMNVLVQLNAHGNNEGNTAVGRLLRSLAEDESLPTDEKETIKQLIAQYKL
jgi:hypothetical protein